MGRLVVSASSRALSGRPARREVVHRPAAALDPFLWSATDAAFHFPKQCIDPSDVEQRALPMRHTTMHRMHMDVLEAR